MHTATAIKNEDVPFALRKTEPNLPAFSPTDRTTLAVIGGFTLSAMGAAFTFLAGTTIAFEAGSAEPGSDHLVIVDEHGALIAIPYGDPREAHGARVGGFHFAPGGNASGIGGGDDAPSINPFSCWDLNFRPTCDDARGMALIGGKFWCDIYLTGAQHEADGSSRIGATIADGDARPNGCKAFDFDTAKAELAKHGKQMLGAEEFFAMAYGVEERSAAGQDPKVTGLDAPRTSRYGIMQATGNMWVWITDGHSDIPRASIAGGSWFSGSFAGSRCAHLGGWPGGSGDNLGVRGRSDHLIPA